MVAVVFAFTGQTTLRSCPHHDGAGAADSDPATRAHAAAPAHGADASEHHAHASDPGIETSESAHQPAGSEHHPDGPCTCLGSCHASAGVPLLATGAPLQAPAGEADGALPALPSSPALRPVPYLLPFANTPPLG